jgi:hypothetical protein
VKSRCIAAVPFALVSALLAAAQVDPRIADDFADDQPLLMEVADVAPDGGGIAGGAPDVIVSRIGDTFTRYGAVNEIAAYAMTTVSCNIGTANAIWIDCTSGNNCNQHPVIGQNLYRLMTVNGTTRFEQIGQSWLKHGFCAADAPSCGSPYVPHSSCDWLGLFATDTYSAGLNAQQSNLGPKSEINPWTGVYPYPFIRGWGQTGNSIFKRLQVRNSDLDPALNVGAAYFAESQYVCTDEPPANRYNNVSWRRANVSGSNGTFNLAFTGSTTMQRSAIEAWGTLDTGVFTRYADVPDDGRFILAYKTTDLGGGVWNYEYALYNMNVNRAAQAFSVPKASGVNILTSGFHDVDYHSGEPYDGTDWPAADSSGDLTWATESYDQNPNANALRWGTLYNFRFTSNAPPVEGSVTIRLFKPGEPASVAVPARVPASTRRPGDLDCNNLVNNFDIDGFVLALTDPAAYALAYPGCAINNADVNSDTQINNLDIDPFVALLLGGG